MPLTVTKSKAGAPKPAALAAAPVSRHPFDRQGRYAGRDRFGGRPF